METNHGVASDTNPEAQRLQVDLWRRMTSLEKAHVITGISRTVQDLSLAGIRMRHPGASEAECLMRLADLKLGRQLTLRVYPEAKELLGS